MHCIPVTREMTDSEREMLRLETVSYLAEHMPDDVPIEHIAKAARFVVLAISGIRHANKARWHEAASNSTNRGLTLCTGWRRSRCSAGEERHESNHHR